MATEKEFRTLHGYKRLPPKSIFIYLQKLRCPPIKKFVFNIIPILHWLPKYNAKSNLLSDFVSGLTVGVMKVSQGLAFSQLAGQHPVFGLYTGLFPAIIYTLFGTSKHLSIGPHATTDMILGATVESLVPSPNSSIANLTLLQTSQDEFYQKRALYAALFSFTTGILLVLFFIFHLGFFARVFSRPLQRGFVFGVVVVLLPSQIKVLLGVSIPNFPGTFAFFKVVYAMFDKLTKLTGDEKTKVMSTSILSLICVVFLALVKYVNEKYHHKFPMKIPIPGEIIIIICTTAVCGTTSLRNVISVLGHVPSGLPTPALPKFSLLTQVVGDIFAITVTGFAISLSLAFTFAELGEYAIRANQEMLALGLTNIFGSFFRCNPAFAAMSRTCVQFESGGKSQLVGWVASVVIMVVLFAGSLLNNTPNACLSAIVIVAVCGLLKNVVDLKELWKTQKCDFLIWSAAALATIFLGVTLGLLVSIFFTLLTTAVKSSLIQVRPLRRIGSSQIYKQERFYKSTSSIAIEQVAITKIEGPINYLNAGGLMSTLTKQCGVDYFAEKRRMKRRLKESKKSSSDFADTDHVPDLDATRADGDDTDALQAPSKVEVLIVDCSAVSFIDSVGVSTVIKLIADFRSIGVDLLLASCCEQFLDAFMEIKDPDVTNLCYVTLDDAVNHASRRSSLQ